jgi:hypothetical protein
MTSRRDRKGRELTWKVKINYVKRSPKKPKKHVAEQFTLFPDIERCYPK